MDTDRHRLDPATVDVVACPLGLGADEVAALGAVLLPEERDRATRFRFDRDRDRFIAGRARLRQVLGAATGRAPADLVFAVSSAGKPRLEGGGRLRFNVAHSGDLMLCAVTLDHEVGIDVEQMQDAVEYRDIARRFFARDEVSRLEALPPPSLREAFFACWTRKEAVVKATGEGLTRPLETFVVSVDPDLPALLSADPSMGPASEWTLANVPVPPGYRATLAVRAPSALRRWDWPMPWNG